MSFSGKKFRRIGCENIEELLSATNASENTIQTLKCHAPIFSFTRIEGDKFNFLLQMDDKVMTHSFTLGEEHEMERRDGSKVKITYTLEGDDVLKQVIKQPDGKTSYFKREFGEKETKMTITMEGTDVQAKIFYEVIN